MPIIKGKKMKKLLLIAAVLSGFTFQASAMVFKRNKDRKFVPVINTGELRYRYNQDTVVEKDETVTPLIIIAKDRDDKPIMVPAKEYKTIASAIRIPETEEIRDILTATSGDMFDAADDKGNPIFMQKTVLNKDAMKKWCDEFKKNSKKPGLWNKDYQEEKEVNYKGVALCCLDSKLARESFKHIVDEANLNCSIQGIQVTYVDKTEHREDPRYAGLQLGSPDDISLKGVQYFVHFDKSSHYKKLKQGDTLANYLENHAFHDALESLETTKEVMQNDLSLFNWIFRNKRYNGTKKSLNTVNDEIAWFKQPKTRDLFAKSSMHPDLYRQLKTARE